MARKKKAKKTPRRRRIGGMKLNPKSPVVLIASAAAGFLLADNINPLVDKVTGTMDKKLVGGIEAGLGAGLMFMKIGKKQPGIVQVAAGGVLAGAGIKRLAKEMGVINGYGRVPVISGSRRVNGYGAVPVLGGYQVPALPSVNGVFNGALNGYEVPRSVAVMGGTASGSGITNSGGGDFMS